MLLTDFENVVLRKTHLKFEILFTYKKNFNILIINEKVLVPCEKWLQISIKCLRSKNPWVWKHVFYESVCLSVVVIIAVVGRILDDSR